MALFNAAGLEIGPSGELVSKAAVSIMGRNDWWQWNPIHEPFSGAWQRALNESTENITAFSAVYASIWRVSADVGKMRIKLIEDEDGDDVWQEVRKGSPYLPVLRKPNRFQTRQQFLERWIQTKLIFGNFYALKERDNRRVVTALYPLHPRRVLPVVTDDGDVYYQINADNLAGVQDDVLVPAEDVIHDRMMCLFHDLIGIPPIYAAAATSTQGLKIQQHAATFFANRAQPGGFLTVPGNLDPAAKEDLREKTEQRYSRENIGRLMVLTGGMKFEPMTVPAEQSQLIEQLQWTAADVARAFGVPLYKLGIGQPTLNNLSALNQHYFADTIHPHVEAIETLLNEGLNLSPYETELDIENLLRMDPESLMAVQEKGVGAAIISPNEARNKLNYVEVKGGESPMIQQQNYSLAAIARRDAQDNPFGPTPAPPEPPEDDDEDEDEDKTIAALSELVVAFKQEPAWLTRNL